ncbi:MAG TPA: hypothetical protein VFN97_22440 [Actinospica sp.]|nr:hypothetical protein [Actinospica sp.]
MEDPPEEVGAPEPEDEAPERTVEQTAEVEETTEAEADAGEEEEAADPEATVQAPADLAPTVEAPADPAATVEAPADLAPTEVTALATSGPATQPVVPQQPQPQPQQGFAPPSMLPAQQAQAQFPMQAQQPQQFPQQPQPQYPGQPMPMPQPPQQQAPYGYPAYGQMPAQYQSMPLPLMNAPVDAAVAKRKQRRRFMVVGAVVVLALVGTGMYVLLSGRSGDSVVSQVTCRPANLSSCLIKAPSGAVQLAAAGSDNWPSLTTATPDQYAADFVTGVQGVGEETQGLLAQDELKSIVHNDWNAVDGNNVDIVLLEFDTQKGAQDWNATRAAEILAEYPGTNTPIPGDATGAAHAAVKADSKGNFDAAYTAVVGRMVLDVAYSSPSQLSTPDLRNWAGTELASLKTEPAPATDPAPKAPGTQQVACNSGLQSCLMSVPGDGSAWTSPSDSKWVSGASLTTSQFVSLFWENESASQQQQVLSNFTADGVTGIAHEDWTVNSGYEQADIYLIQTITAAGASALDTSNFGEPQWGGGLSGVSYNVPNASGTQAWYTNKQDSNGFTDFAYTTNVGNVIVMGWFYYYGSFDSGTTNSWVTPELDRVQASEQTLPLGLLPLNKPTLPAASQGTCSGDCLIGLPGNTTDTTSSSYQTTKALTAAGYADRYETTASADVNTWLMSDGFVSGEHRSWSASGGATADAVLLKYGTPAQAQAATLFDYGANAANNRVCTDTAVPGSYCLAAPVSADDMLQKETVRVLAWKGDYEVSVSVTTSNSADLAQAYGWAQQQLNKLPAN